MSGESERADGRESDRELGDGEAPTRADLDVPEWDDEYLDRVAERLMYNYDMERNRTVEGTTFPLYGHLRVENHKQFVHPAINWANHERREHLLVTRVDRPRRADLERLVDLGHDLADEWITADEEHFGTDFVFVVVAEELPAEIRSFVDGFRDRTLLKFGYYGQYEIRLVVVAPEAETSVASEGADVARAFELWRSPEEAPGGVLSRLARFLGSVG